MNIQDLTKEELSNLILITESETTASVAFNALKLKIKEGKSPANALNFYSNIAGIKKEYYEFIPESTCLEALELIKDLHGEIKHQLYKELSKIAQSTRSEQVAIRSLLILNELVNKDNLSSISSAFKSVAINSSSTIVCAKALEHLYKLFEKFEETRFFRLSTLWEIFSSSEKLKVKHLAFLNLAKENFFENKKFLDYRFFRSEILYKLESYEKAGDTYD